MLRRADLIIFFLLYRFVSGGPGAPSGAVG
jgi:hypothetical protein